MLSLTWRNRQYPMLHSSFSSHINIACLSYYLQLKKAESTASYWIDLSLANVNIVYMSYIYPINRSSTSSAWRESRMNLLVLSVSTECSCVVCCILVSVCTPVGDTCTALQPVALGGIQLQQPSSTAQLGLAALETYKYLYKSINYVCTRTSFNLFEIILVF